MVIPTKQVSKIRKHSVLGFSLGLRISLVHGNNGNTSLYIRQIRCNRIINESNSNSVVLAFVYDTKCHV